MIFFEGSKIKKTINIMVLFAVIAGVFHVSLDVDFHQTAAANAVQLKSPSADNKLLSNSKHCPFEAPTSESATNHCCHHTAHFMLPYALSYSQYFEIQPTFMFLQKVLERSISPLDRPPIA